ncbi:MAG: hypothetical protein KDD55_05905 [Bdellovibrionales bacterium]|nr:hypothetical protein [Bdellovibrionales bacterium]
MDPTPIPSMSPDDQQRPLFPPVVVTAADKFALKVMAPSFVLLEVIGALGGIGWVGRKVGLFKEEPSTDGQQTN